MRKSLPTDISLTLFADLDIVFLPIVKQLPLSSYFNYIVLLYRMLHPNLIFPSHRLCLINIPTLTCLCPCCRQSVLKHSPGGEMCSSGYTLQLIHVPGPTWLSGCLSGDSVIVLWDLKGSAGEHFGCENSFSHQTEGLDRRRMAGEGLRPGRERGRT